MKEDKRNPGNNELVALAGILRQIMKSIPRSRILESLEGKSLIRESEHAERSQCSSRFARMMGGSSSG